MSKNKGKVPDPKDVLEVRMIANDLLRLAAKAGDAGLWTTAALLADGAAALHGCALSVARDWWWYKNAVMPENLRVFRDWALRRQDYMDLDLEKNAKVIARRAVEVIDSWTA